MIIIATQELITQKPDFQHEMLADINKLDQFQEDVLKIKDSAEEIKIYDIGKTAQTGEKTVKIKDHINKGGINPIINNPTGSGCASAFQVQERHHRARCGRRCQTFNFLKPPIKMKPSDYMKSRVYHGFVDEPYVDAVLPQQLQCPLAGCGVGNAWSIGQIQLLVVNQQ